MEIYSSSDYAGMCAKNFNAYYGYEEQDEDGDTCFVARIDGLRIKYPFKNLGLDNSYRWECEKCLLAGISKIFEEYKLVKK